MEKVIITKHAKDRFKERLGIPKRACLKQAEKAYNEGYCHSQAKGKAKRFLDGLFLKYKTANNLKVFNGFVYIFIKNTLITVIPLPKNMIKGF